MFARLAHLMYRHRWWVVGIWVAILALSASQAARVGSVLGPGDFTLPGSDSQHAALVLQQQFHEDNNRVVLVIVHNPSLTVRDTAFERVVAATARRIQQDTPLHALQVTNPIQAHNPQLIARDGHSVAILLSSSLKEQDIEAQIDHLRAVIRTPGYTTYVTGTPALNHDYAVSTKNDLSLGESITVPILILILLFVFGSLVASALPLILAACSITVSLALVFVLAHLLDTSVYVTNVVTVLGLGIGIDYSLFIVYRFREELETSNVEQAVVRTMETTGRAVFFSGLTVAIGLASLILTGLSFMQSMGMGGVLVPATSLLAALTLLPAVLGILGPRVNRWQPLTPLRWIFRRPANPRSREIWHRIAMTIMRRPIVSGGLVLLIMLGLIYPAHFMKFSFGSLKNSPPANSVSGFVLMQQHFSSQPDPTEVVVQSGNSLLNSHSLRGLRALENRLRQDPEAVRLIGPTDLLLPNGHPIPGQQALLFSLFLSRDGHTAVINITPRHDTGTSEAEGLVTRSRTVARSFERGALRGTTIMVGGAEAGYTDFNHGMYDKFPLIVTLVLLLSYAFLFVAFRSVFLPLKAVLLNLLSVGASFGLLTLVFQFGVGHTLLGFYTESGVASWVPIFLFAFLFGLSMDYEVFLLSRIREHWLATGNNEQSVAFGLERTGRLITSAAAIMVIAFSGFLIGHEIQLKEFGFGMLAAVALDASLIRLVLVPSIMAVMGRWNWWVPSGLRAWAGRGLNLEGERLQPEPERQPVTA